MPSCRSSTMRRMRRCVRPTTQGCGTASTPMSVAPIGSSRWRPNRSAMDLDELAPLVPVALSLDPPAIDWGDLGGMRFSEPFFDQTIERWAGGTPPPRLLRTGFDALDALDAAPSLEPTALIFHLSRCGSTLLSRLLATLPATLVIAEPRPLNTLLMSDPSEIG